MGFLGRMTFVGQPITANRLAAGATAADITMSGVLVLPAGSSSAPSIQFTGSGSNTGIYASPADNIVVARLGTIHVNSSSNLLGVETTLQPAHLQLLGALRIDAESIKTISYQVTNTDSIVIMNGSTLTATLPATPGTDQLVWIKNRNSGNLTVGRNALTIDGAAADLTLAAGEAALLYFEPSGWIRLGF